MRTFKAGDKYIVIHSTATTVYSAQGKNEEEAKGKLREMMKKGGSQ